MPLVKLAGSALRLAAGEAQRRLKEHGKKKKKKAARVGADVTFDRGFSKAPKRKPDTRSNIEKLEEALKGKYRK